MRITGFMPQVTGFKPVKFSGYHPDAVVGGDVLVAGAQQQQENTAHIFFKLKNSGLLQPHSNKTRLVLRMNREPANKHDKNAIELSYTDRQGKKYKLGYVPKDLAVKLAPMMDAGHRFNAVLTKIKPYKLNGGTDWHHQLTTRIEYLSEADKAPSLEMQAQVQTALQEALDNQDGWKRILTVVPEEINLHKVGKQELMEKRDKERKEISYYLKGQLLTRVPLNAESAPVPEYQQPKVPVGVKKKIKQLLDTSV